MTFIETIPEDEATGAVAEIYAADRERYGFVPNFTRAFSHRPGRGDSPRPARGT